MLGGPADGMRYTLDAQQRTFRCVESPLAAERTLLDLDAAAKPPTPTAVNEHHYTIGIILGRHGSVNHVGVLNLNDCAIRTLLAGYRKPTAHDSDENVAEQLVTILGGSGDGDHVPALTDCTIIRHTGGDEYRVVPLVGKDQVQYRVALRDPQTECPIAMLVEGYRQKVGK